HHIRPCTKQSSEFQADCAARRYQSVDLQDLQNTPQMPPSHPPPASLNTMRVESILFHAATRSRNVKNIPNAIPLDKKRADQKDLCCRGRLTGLLLGPQSTSGLWYIITYIPIWSAIL